MEFTKDLPHQTEVVSCISDIIGIDGLFEKENDVYSNPKLVLDEENKKILYDKIKEYNNKIEDNKLHFNPIVENYLNIDIKMETGTGKTYAYVKTIYELAKFGIKKFIIVVPSNAIKIGTESFINSTRSYFEKKYNKTIFLQTQEPNKGKNLQGKQPIEVKSFVEQSIIADNQINVLLLNHHYLNNGNYGKEREESINDYYIPADAICSIKPFIIIDEPHRYKDENSTMEFIKNRIKPQCIIRFGATFPNNTGGIKDYKNLIYDLNSRKSFLENIIKGINIYIEGKKKEDVISFNLSSFKKGESVTIKYKIKGDKNKPTSVIVPKGSLLNFLGEDFKGVRIEDISSDEIYLSNGNSISKNIKANEYSNKNDVEIDEDKDQYNSYDFSKDTQEAMIDIALKKHFETEKKNFLRDDKIKTICLFFIGDIDSYRKRDKDGKCKQWLKEMFEQKLISKLKEEIEKINAESDENINEYILEYRKYLEVTLENLKDNTGNKQVHAGYFSDDKDKSEDSEYYKILKDKEGTLSIKNIDGSYNTFRFIFSKWTLKEGWDNPNVFTIAKLSGSGSEISKLQEVGRGLRLPVDINMKRKEGEQFYLSYIVNHNEEDFASKLLDEVNGISTTRINNKDYLKVEQIQKILENKEDENDFGELLIKLISEKIINPIQNQDIQGYEIIDFEKYLSNYAKYLNDGITGTKVTIGDSAETGKSKIRKENFKKIEKLWKTLNQNFIITYSKDAFKDDEMENIVYKSLIKLDNELFNKNLIEFTSIDINETIKKNNNNLSDEDTNTDYIFVEHYRTLKYSEFIKKISFETNIPIININNAIKKYLKEKGKHCNYKLFFRTKNRDIIIAKVKEIKHEKLSGLFSYQFVSQRNETKLTDKNGNMKLSVNSSDLGIKKFQGSAHISDKYLYDDVLYDSPIELNNIKTEPSDSIEVYGKIPKNSVRIPKIDGATCTPDFMYVVKNEKGNTKKINLIVESKDVDNEKDLRGTEINTQEYMKKYFEILEKNTRDENIKFSYQFKQQNVQSIINSLENNIF